MKCWDCKNYSRPKAILFGLGETKGECKFILPRKCEDVIESKDCCYYKKGFWKGFWDRVTRTV